MWCSKRSALKVEVFCSVGVCNLSSSAPQSISLLPISLIFVCFLLPLFHTFYTSKSSEVVPPNGDITDFAWPQYIPDFMYLFSGTTEERSRFGNKDLSC